MISSEDEDPGVAERNNKYVEDPQNQVSKVKLNQGYLLKEANI